MAHLERSVACLRIMGDEREPQAISQWLGVFATPARRKGENFAPAHRPVQPRRTGCWKVQAPPAKPADLDAQVRELRSTMSKDPNLWPSITSAHEVDLYSGWLMGGTHGGDEIAPQTLMALGERGIRLGLDIHAPTDDE